MLYVTSVSVVLLASCTAGKHFAVPNSAEQTANGSPSFQYFSINSHQAAASLLQLLVGLDKSIYKFTEDLLQTNNATLDLQTYQMTVEAVKHTNCSNNDKDKDHVMAAARQIVIVIETCRSFVSQGKRSSLRKAIMKSVRKIQKYDNLLRSNAYECSAMRAPPSSRCDESKQEALDGIRRVVSNSKMSKFGYLDRKAFFHIKNSINSCVTASIESLRADLASLTKQILECDNQQLVLGSSNV